MFSGSTSAARVPSGLFRLVRHSKSQRDSAAAPRPSLLLLATAVLFVFLFGGCGTELTEDHDPGPEPARDEQSRELLADRDRLWEKAQQHQQQGRFEEAIASGEQLLALERQVYGDVDDEIAGTLSWLAEQHERLEDFASARAVRQELVQIKTRLYGEDHWRVTNARLALAHVDQLAELNEDQRERLLSADDLEARSEQLRKLESYDEALDLSQQVLEAREEILGPDHRDYAKSLHYTARLAHMLGDTARAEQLLRKALTLRMRILGERHPDSAATVNNLGLIAKSRGDLEKAEKRLRHATEIWRTTVGEDDAYFAMGAYNLGWVLYRLERYAEGALHFQEAGAAYERLDRHVEAAWTWGGQGDCYRDAGYDEQAVAAYGEAAQRFAELEHDQGLAQNSHQLGEALHRLGHFAEAVPHFKNAAAAYEALGRNIEAAWMFGWKANCYGDAEDHERAVVAYGEAVRRFTELKHDEGLAPNALGLGLALRRLGHYQKAAPHYEAAAAAFDRLQWHVEAARSLGGQGDCHRDAGDDQQAVAAYTEAVRRFAKLQHNEGLATNASQLGRALHRLERYAEALPQFQIAAAAYEHLDQPVDAALMFCWQGDCHHHAGDDEQTVTAYAEAKRRFAELEFDEGLAASAVALGQVYFELGQYDRALELADQAVETIGTDHPDYSEALFNQATARHQLGHYADAEPIYREVLAIWEERLAPENENYLQALNNLAVLLMDIGDYAAAESLYQRVLKLRRNALGEHHPDYAASLHNLATLYMVTESESNAETYFLRAIAAWQSSFRPEDLGHALTLSNLGYFYILRGDLERAEEVLQRSARLHEQHVGVHHRSYGWTVFCLGMLAWARGDVDEAAQLATQAWESMAQSIGEAHPAGTWVLVLRAAIYSFSGNEHEARLLLSEGLERGWRNVEQTARIQSERQQLAMARAYRNVLDIGLSLAMHEKASSHDLYSHVLYWKGMVLLRQRAQRAVAGEPELEALFAEMQHVAAELATRALSPPDPQLQEAWREELAKLSQRQEELERQLASKSAAYREAMEPVTTEAVKAVLPEDAVLIDFLQYNHYSLAPGEKRTFQWDERLAAFIIRKNEPVVLKELGAVDALTDLIGSWRGDHDFGRSKSSMEAGHRLRERLWEPLAPHLADAGIVLVSPDGALGRIPLGALPGNEPDTYLLQEVALAVVPIPQQLPSFLTDLPSEAEDHIPPSLLLVGDVDYGGRPGLAGDYLAHRSPTVAAQPEGLQFAPLAHTRTEILAVRDSFEVQFPEGQVAMLRRGQATESAFRSLAPQYRWLHMATHGFFAPSNIRSALARTPDASDGLQLVASDAAPAGFHPGLLSGLALAGANTPPEPDEDDGILTALEVAALDLSNVQVVVLSACETGLGDVAGGEGLLGLQRAFQIAGAQSTVASLWEVPDLATSLLMQRFYENLWDREMPKLEALREAQLWLMEEGAERGVQRVDDPSWVDRRRLPPYYWGAFVLSGDWQ